MEQQRKPRRFIGVSPDPNPVAVLWSILRSRRVRQPSPLKPPAIAEPSHKSLGVVLDAVSHGGISAIEPVMDTLDLYLADMSRTDPDDLGRDAALAYWINVYNAGTLKTVAHSLRSGADSVLRMPGAFTKPRITVVDELLSLDNIEHGKVRRFSDPRIHGALVCGSVSCPTLRRIPFDGATLQPALDDQMRTFMLLGGYRLDRWTNTLTLARVFKWYGRDFTHPTRMPTVAPARASRVAVAISGWMTDKDGRYVRESEPSVTFASYDWTLGCSIA